MPAPAQFEVAIVGAGAAGLICAISAGRRGRRVLLLDHADEPGKKILISGGGRCNFTNLHAAPDRFLSQNPAFCRSALARYTQHDFIALVEKHNIAYHEKTLGQLFCDGSARTILAMLLKECQDAGVVLRLGQRVADIEHGDGFALRTDSSAVQAQSLVLATGGLSIPKMGATDFAHRTARRFGLAVTETRPGLVPLTFGAADLALMKPITGLSTEAIVACAKGRFREAILFTHRGLSGPAILQISSYWREGAAITVDLLPGTNATDLLRDRKKSRPRAEVKTILAEHLPQRLAQAVAEELRGPIAEITDKKLLALAQRLNAWRIVPVGTEGYAKAEVTLGGVDTRGLSSKTMEATGVPGLYVVGEAVDVTGWLGGYNFQWAWSSGWVAGQAA
ncbi:MAG: NAD(P)/FAD-dependent oxidoreductase [Rhodospirillales bacterium]|nr:NAD(P)/FAD-dependent oxidoreductase [Rhodospirillales bacterium]